MSDKEYQRVSSGLPLNLQHFPHIETDVRPRVRKKLPLRRS